MKKLRKSLLALLLVGVMIFTFIACAMDEESAEPEEELEEESVLTDPVPEEEPAPEPAMYDLKLYKIVYPRVENTVLGTVVEKLQSSLKKKGAQLSVINDGEAESEYEILIGDTNRSASAEALTQIESEKGYVIGFYDKKIVINANSDEVWEQAVKYFVDHYVTDEVNQTVQVKQGHSYAAVQRDLAKNGTFLYQLVVGSKASDAVKSSAATLKTKLQSLTGLTVTQTTDSSYQKNKAEIVIGDTSYIESIDARSELQINQYGVRIKDSKIVVRGHHDVTNLLAIEHMIGLLDQATANGGNLYAYLPLNGCETYSAWLGDIPAFSQGTYGGVYECANNNIQVLYSKVTRQQVNDYAQQLCSYGYECKEEHQAGNNYSATYLNEKGLVHLTYLDYDKSLRIVTDPLTETVYKDGEPEFLEITQTTLAVSTLNYTHREETDGNGMSYVVTLPDGRFVIFDGGYADQKTGESDATILYNFLKDNNKRTDGKIVIAAWVISHSHGDHYGALDSFTRRYADKVQVQYFVYNTTTQSICSSHNTFLEKTLPTYIPTHYVGTQVIKPHVGQVLKFCDVEFEVLYTHEIFAPTVITNENNGSLVLRMHVNDQTVLFTGDCEVGASNLLCRMYGDYLKSDILQINHHGYSGGTEELYGFARPTYTIWPTSQAAFNLRTTGVKYQWVSQQAVSSNKYVYDMVGKTNCFVADGPVEIIHFPLKDRLRDIKYYTPKYQ